MFIKGLFETHLYVENLERSMAFYRDVLGLEACYYEEGRRAAFFWIGKPKEAMLGLWEKPTAQIEKRHFAFSCTVDFILNEAVTFLQKNNLNPRNFLNNGKAEPMVFAWMPALAVYFDDPDGHSLELIAILEGEAWPELGVLSFADWQAAQKK
jgi:catechol-2,3-dioxygenase